MSDLFGDDRGAVFSICRTWRYRLWRKLGGTGPRVLFLLLNPSTADESTNDPTVARCCTRSIAWGFGLMEVCNIFAFRATDPRDMMAAPDPIGPENDGYIEQAANRAQTIICGWGEHGAHMNRGRHVTGLLRAKGYDLHCLRKNVSQHPCHPLYLPYGLPPIPLTGLPPAQPQR